jgi:hypothetical protein
VTRYSTILPSSTLARQSFTFMPLIPLKVFVALLKPPCGVAIRKVSALIV